MTDNGGADISSNGSDAPSVKIIPPLIYLAGLVIGCLATAWLPTNVVPNLAAWVVGGILICCGAVLTGSAVGKFKHAGTTMRPDRPATALVTAGPYWLTRNPMYLGLALVYSGLAIADQSLWALILLPVALTIIRRHAIEPEEALLERRFGADYLGYKARVRRWM